MALELYYNSQWNDAPVYERDGCVVMRGTNDIGNDTEPASGSSTIDNRSGDYSPRSLVSNLRGLIGQNTKSRYVVDGEVVLTGEMAAWRPERDVGGDAWTKAEVGGVLRRIGRGKDAFRPALRRAYDFDPPHLLWPLDDPKDTTIAAGSYPLVVNGPVEFAGELGVAGANGSLWCGVGVDATIPELGGYLRADFPSDGFSATGWQVEFSGRYHTSAPDGLTAGVIFTVGVREGSGQLNFVMNTALWDGASHHVSFWLYQDGADVKADSYRDGVFANTQTVGVGTTLGLPNSVILNSIGVDDGLRLPSLSYVAFYTSFHDPAERGAAAYAWRGETAGDRFTRVCLEQGITPTVVGDVDDTVPMHVQPLDTFLGILDEIARTDDAAIFETRDSVGLTMRTGASRQNQAPVLTVSYIGEVQPPLRPEYGDRGIRNDVTAQGSIGPDQRVEQLTGPRNIQAPEDDPQGVGRYATSLDVNPSTVDALYNAAGWRVNVGCFDGTWYAEITVDLDAAPHLTDDVALIDIGDVLELTDTPEDESLEAFRGLVVGIRNKTGTHRRLVTFYCIPAEPYQTGVLAETTGDTDPFVGHLETDGTVTYAAIAVGATTFRVVTTGPWWTTDEDDYPYDLIVDGQRVTVTACGPRDRFDRTVSSGMGSEPVTGVAYTISGGAASDYSVGSGVAVQSAGSVNVSRSTFLSVGATDQDFYIDVMVTPGFAVGAPITQWAMVRATDVNNCYIARLDISTTGVVSIFLSKIVATVTTTIATAVNLTPVHTGSSWWRIRVQAIGSAIKAYAWAVATDAEPTGWQVTATDTDLTTGTLIGFRCRLTAGNTNVSPVLFSWDNLTVNQPQTFTVSGVEHPISAGASVTVQQPIILAQ
jgi:hypothetical protein